MKKSCRFFFIFLILAISTPNIAYSQASNLLPKYGETPKNEAQLLADKQFFAKIDEYYKGDRKKAAEDAAMRGWQFLKEGNAQDAMRRFNQAWLLDNSSGIALWGMGAIEATQGKADSSLKLFAEAEQYIGNDIAFAVDYARTIGLAAVNKKDTTLLNEAFNRFDSLHKRAPQNILNLQNWAITLFYMGNFSEAWGKIKLAEAAPRANELDRGFIAALEKKMPRPK